MFNAELIPKQKDSLWIKDNVIHGGFAAQFAVEKHELKYMWIQ